MRITAGKLKNREVFSPNDKDKSIRPTSSKTRMAVFNILAHSKFHSEIDFLTEENPSLIKDRVIADIYCGTGIIGFEALSRGAKTVLFVDKNGQTVDMAKKSALKLGVYDDCIFIRANATMLSAQPVKSDVIFIDPPYNQNLVVPTLQAVAANMWARDGGVIVVEHNFKEKIEPFPPFTLLDQREYGHTLITILKVNY